MGKYNLQANEWVILKEAGIAHGGLTAVYTDELILTNFNLVHISKGIFGKTKGVRVFPIDQIKVFDNNVQAILGKRPNGTPQLEVYFINGQENFGFKNRKTTVDWVNKISYLLTGEETNMKGSLNRTIPGTEFIAESLKDTFNTVKDVFGLKSRKETVQVDKKVVKKCDSCRATISGLEGQVVRCQYCDTEQKL